MKQARPKTYEELEADIDDLTNRYNKVLSQLTNAVRDVENDKISPEDLMSAFLRLPTELALSYFGTMSILLALNPTWQKYAPQIQEQILAKQKEQQDRQEKKQDKVIDSMQKAANKPTTQNIYGDKNEFQGGAQLLKMGLPEDADPAEIAARIAEQQKQIEKKNK